MNQLNTQGIILSRRDFAEADRIITLLTPDYGKLTLMAKGVRRVKSKLAGGIELFSVSEITFVKGRGDVGTLVSTRLIRHYGQIVQHLDRTMLGYDLIKLVAKVTQDEPEEDYFHVLDAAFKALNDSHVSGELIRCCLLMQLLQLGGATPNLRTDTNGSKLESTQLYRFDYTRGAFTQDDRGMYGVNHIKLLRLGFAGNNPAALQQVKGVSALVKDVQGLIATMATENLHT